MIPGDSSVTRNRKYVEERKRLGKTPPEIIMGPKSSSEEIWIDGIDHLLHNSFNNEGLNQSRKDICMQNRSSYPGVLEYNNIVKAQDKSCLDSGQTDELQEYLVGNV